MYQGFNRKPLKNSRNFSASEKIGYRLAWNKLPNSLTLLIWLGCISCLIYIICNIYDPVIRPVLDVIPPFAGAFLLAFMLDPIVDKLQSRGISRGWGVAIVGSAFIILLVAVGILIIPAITRQVADLSANYQSYASEASDRITALIKQYSSILEKFHLPTTVDEWTSRFSRQTESAAQTGISTLAAFVSSALSKVLWLIIVPLAGLWLLKDIDYLKAKLLHITPVQYREKLSVVGSAVGAVFFKYLRGMATVAIIYSATASLLFTLFGLKYGLVIGCVAGILYLVPYVGVLSIVFVVCISVLIQPPYNVHSAILLSGIIIVMSFGLFDQLITPRVVGSSVGVHPVLSLFALALGARLFGVVGVIVAVPVTAAIQVVIGEFCPRIYQRVQVGPVNEPETSGE